jgi:hypothetical protein
MIFVHLLIEQDMILLLVQVMYWKKENNKNKIIDKNFHQQYDHAKQMVLVMFDVHLIYQHHKYLNPFLRRRKQTV